MLASALWGRGAVPVPVLVRARVLVLDLALFVAEQALRLGASLARQRK